MSRAPPHLIDSFVASLEAGCDDSALQKAKKLTIDYPSDPLGWKGLGVAYKLQQKPKLALKPMLKAVRLDPKDAEAHNNLADTQRDCGMLLESLQSCKAALSLDPDYMEAYHNQANALSDLLQLEEAEQSYRQALELKPTSTESLKGLANLLKDLGRNSEAQSSIRAALSVSPGDLIALDTLLFVLNYDPAISPAELFAEYEAYGEAVASATKHRFDHDDRGSVEGRRIRIGYSSPDFRGHVCRFFMEPIFRNHNLEQFELFAYSNTSSPDQHTERMKGYFDHWVDVVRMTDEQMAQRIYDDQIDILVDMAGHTVGNRLPVFAMRPAPIQASSAIGYAYTTGLKEVDYFICDENLVPAGSEPYFSEQPWRLPAPGYVYEPPRDATPEVSALPALRNGYVTFGSLTRLTRLNDPLLRVWGEILNRIPGSRLRLDQKPFAHEGTREMFWKRLEGLGVPRDRVDLTCSTPHWQAYQDIDITLDCWPHNAGTTTIDSLMMGVPVLSKLDRPSVGRVGAMSLEPLGLGDWLVADEEGFVEKAVAAASDLGSLATLRKQLRSRLESSVLLDGAAFTQNLEEAYRAMAVAGEHDRQSLRPLSECTTEHSEEGSAKPPLADSTGLQDQLDGLLAQYQSGDFQKAEQLAGALTTEFPQHPFAWKILGVLYAQTGRLQQSVAPLRKCTELEPMSAESHYNFAIVLQDLARFGDAEASYQQSITLQPDNGAAHYNLGNLYLIQGRLEEAAASYTRSIELEPDSAEAHINLGNIFQLRGQLSDAEDSYTRATDADPNLAKAHYNLGLLFAQLSKPTESEECYKTAIALKPDYAEAHNNLGSLLVDRGKLEDAEASYRRAIALNPDYADAHYNLANVFKASGKLLEAESSYRQALAATPDFSEACHNLGDTLQQLERFEEAKEQYDRVIALRPDKAMAWNGRGAALRHLGSLDEAEASYRQAIAFDPDFSEAHNNLGSVLHSLGKLEESLASLRKAIQLAPEFFGRWSNLLFFFNYDPAISPAELFAEYEAYGEAVASATKHRFDHDDRGSVEGRRIRIGYSSPDFRGHVCRFFMEPIFRNHNLEQFELFAYSNTSSPDQHTERMKGYFDHWVDVVRMTDEQMAQRIYDDQIDILVDMAGHTVGNRLPVFAMRPAPIQASSAIGYAYTTGLKEVDYFICDENLVPAGSEPYFSEQPWRLPAPGYVYEPPRDATPEVSALPALRNGYVTFGSLTRLTRLNDPLLRVWGEILNRIPGSRLRLDQKPFAHEGTREMFWKRLEGLGVPRDRVDLTCSTPHWQAYQDIDITLDCWPHNAGTTTIDSLMMGVPVLSKLDRPSVGRVGAMSLEPLGLGDWLVADEEGFVEKAVAAASDLGSLATLRKQLRSRLESSVLLDGAAFTQNLEEAYLQMVGTEKGDAIFSERGRVPRRQDLREEEWVGQSGFCKEPPKQKIEQLLACFKRGQIDEAERLAKYLTRDFPEHGYGWMVLSAILRDAGRASEALSVAEQAVTLSPASPEAHYNMGNILADLSRAEAAEASYRAAIGLNRDFAAAYRGLGDLQRNVGRIEDSKASYLESIRINPRYTEAYIGVGAICAELSLTEEAERYYLEAIRLRPECANAHSSLGALYIQMSRLQDAERLCRQAIQLEPSHAQGYNNLGDVLNSTCRYQEAIECLKTAIKLKPTYAEAHNNLGIALKGDGEFDGAEASFRQAVNSNPTFGTAYTNLGTLLRECGRYNDALISFEKALRLSPDDACLHANIGLLLGDLGNFDDASAHLQKAVSLESDSIDFQDNLLFVLNYAPGVTVADLFRKYEAYGEVVASAATKRRFEHDDRAPVEGRRIRIGYSSPDLRGHACRFFIEPIFRNHNLEQFELFAYSNTSSPDQHTERMKGYFDHWVDVVRMTDEELAQRIYDDQIDILVDLAGHTKGNRLPVFAMRPAPIQASYFIGFVYTTGLKEVDYFICDENLVPAGSENYFSEKPWRLPAPGYVYEPPRDATPEVSALPALRNGYVTFGSMTRLTRLNDPLLRVWGEILERVPNSRLRLVRQPFAYEETRKMFWQRLEGLGIPRDRVDLTCSTPHWQAYHDIDITLDCWPQNSGTTTFESLWMGVPVLSKIDRPSVGRWGAAALSPLGLADWLVDDEESFVERAVAAASDLELLAGLRSGLRERLEQGPHMDAAAVTRHLENAYRNMLGGAEEKLTCYPDYCKSSRQSKQPIDANASSSPDSPPQEKIDCLLAYHQAGKIEQAEELARSLTQEFPRHPFGWKAMGVLLRVQGRLSEALIPMKRAIELAPDDKESSYNLSITLTDLGQFRQAVAIYEQLLASQPGFPEAHNQLGVALAGLGKLSEAEASCKKAIALSADFAEAFLVLGNVLKQAGKLNEAQASYREVIRLWPESFEAHSNLGAVQLDQGFNRDARTSLERAVDLKPASALASYNLGTVYLKLGQYKKAEKLFRKATALDPQHAGAHNNLGNTLRKLGRLAEAESSYGQAIAIEPDYAEAHNNLGFILQAQGRFEEAQTNSRKAIDLKPEYFAAHSNLLFGLNYDPCLSAAELFREYEAYGVAVAEAIQHRFDHTDRPPAIGRRVRIGYSSPDLRGHACRFFIEPIFRNHNLEQFELFAYSNTSSPDQHTERMKGYFDHWVDVVRMTDEELAQRIYDDQIDILVDLAGHTKGNRLPVFAMCPAPIQASYFIGFVYTTGLKEVDYFICDENLVPAGSENYFSEKPWRLPAPGYVYEPPRDATPEVSALPALRNGYVTFGSMTRLTRLNDPLLRVWGEILERVPNSRLRLVRQPFAYEETRKMFWQRLEGLGIPRDRVDLTCSTPHWQAYHDIDITLDCWPQNSGTTTFESLWMGVPVLSKIDRPSVGRWGAAALKPLGLEDWLVETVEAFVESAVAFAYDLDSLSKLRAELRGRLEQGPHTDASAMTKHLEDAYRQLIRGGGGGFR